MACPQASRPKAGKADVKKAFDRRVPGKAFCKRHFRGGSMATAATRQKELEQDWRDRLRDSMRRLLLRSLGVLLTGAGVAGGLALASHSSTDPSFTTAAAGPPANWLGP